MNVLLCSITLFLRFIDYILIDMQLIYLRSSTTKICPRQFLFALSKYEGGGKVKKKKENKDHFTWGILI
jgi:hypothetical protein